MKQRGRPQAEATCKPYFLLAGFRERAAKGTGRPQMDVQGSSPAALHGIVCCFPYSPNAGPYVKNIVDSAVLSFQNLYIEAFCSN